jgi:hypothetical protein
LQALKVEVSIPDRLLGSRVQGRAVDGLKALKKQRVSTKVLAETQAGKRVKALAKHPKADVAAAAAQVVAAWKEAVRQEAGDGGAAASGATSSKATGGGSSRATAGGDNVPSSQQTVASSTAPVIDPDTVPRSGDTIRDKCRQNLAASFALAVGEGVAGDPVVAAVAVENEIFKQNGGVTQVGRWPATLHPGSAPGPGEQQRAQAGLP